MNFVVYFILPMLLVILQQGCLQVTLRTIWQNVHDPGSGSKTQGHLEKWVQKSCVSFEEECISIIKSWALSGFPQWCTEQSLPPRKNWTEPFLCKWYHLTNYHVKETWSDLRVEYIVGLTSESVELNIWQNGHPDCTCGPMITFLPCIMSHYKLFLISNVSLQT